MRHQQAVTAKPTTALWPTPRSDYEYTRMEWVDWFGRRLGSLLDYVPSEEYAAA